MSAMSNGEAAAYLNAMLQQHILQGGKVMSQDSFSTISIDQHFTWRYETEHISGGTWTHYDVKYSRESSSIAVHASSTKYDEWGCDSINIPFAATAQRVLTRCVRVLIQN